MVFKPISLQEKVFLESVFVKLVVVWHASNVPLSIWEAEIVTKPEGSNWTVISLVDWIGAIVGIHSQPVTITLKLHVDVFPLVSLTVKTTGFVEFPRSLIKVEVDNDCVTV